MTRLALALILATTPALADDVRIRDYDGDTDAWTTRLTIDGALSFDAPETSYRNGAECDLEIERGKAALAFKKRLQAEARRVDDYPLLDALGRTRRDALGRLLTRRVVDGTNIGLLMEREGHAMTYYWQSEKIDWCNTPPTRRAKEKR